MPETPAVESASTAADSPPTARHRTAGTPQLILLIAATCMPILGAVLIAPVLPQMSAYFADTSGVGLLVPMALTAPALLIGLTAPFAGLIADKVDRKRILLIAMVCYAVVGTAPLYLDTLGAILASRALLGICEAAIMTSVTTLIGDYWSGARRARYLGIQTLVSALAATAFLTLGGALGELGWRVPFWMYASSLLLVIPMALLLWQPERPASSDESAPARTPWGIVLVPCLVTLFGGVVFYALIVQLSYVLDGIGLTSTAAIGGVTAIMSLATAVGAGCIGRLSGHSPRTLLPIEFALAAVGLGIVFAGTTVPVITLGAVVTGFGTGLLLPTLLMWATNRLDFAQRGRGTGLWTGSMFIGQFFTPLVIGAMAAAVGGLQSALGVLGLASAVMAVIALTVVRRDTPSLNASH